MKDIYEILSTHFAEKNGRDHDEAVDAFRKDHELEYHMLARLWQRNDIQVKDFDVGKAWKNMELSVAESKDTKIFVLTPAILKLAAAVMIFLLGAVAVYYYQVYIPAQVTATVHVSSPKRGADIALADGTIVWLNKNTSLKYPKTFKGETRSLELSGEAFFEVKEDPGRPFVVRTKNTHIIVTGTSFNVRATDDMTEITVKTGRVRIRNLNTGKEEVITPGYSARVVHDQLTRFQTDNPNYLSWKTGRFRFNHAPLQQVVRDLNTYFSKKMIVDKERPVNCNLTAQFNQTSQEEILEIIRLTCSCEIGERADGYYISALKSNKP